MIAPLETSVLRIVVPGVPVAWARAGRGMGARTGGVPVTFTPERQRSWQALAQAYMSVARGTRPLLAGPLSVLVVAVWPRPKNVAKREGTGRRWRSSRPDADNVGKQVCDSAIGVLYADDAIVVDLRIQKVVAAEGEAPHVEIVVEELSPRSEA